MTRAPILPNLLQLTRLLMPDTTTNIDFSQPSRQSPIAIFLIVQKLIVQLVRQLWPLFVVLILNYFNFQAKSSDRNGEMPFWTEMIFYLGAFSTIGSIISYFRFFYYIEDEELVIRSGFLWRTDLNLPFNRIQTINFEQSLIHQAFNVVRVEIDSAGTGKNEIRLEAIKRERAEALRAYILEEKAKNPDISEREKKEQLAGEEKSTTLLKLGPSDLLKIGVSQNHLRGVGVIMGFLFWVFQSVEEFLPDYEKGKNPVEYLEEDLQLGAIFNFWIYLLFVLLILAVIISLLITVVRYFDLHFNQTSKGFKVVSGLFTRREASATFQKIQYIQWRDTLLKRLFGMFRLNLFQASSETISYRSSIQVPGCYEEQIDKVRAIYFPDESEFSYTQYGISRKIIGRRLLFIGLIPGALWVLWCYLTASYSLLVVAIIWLVLIYWTSRRYHQNWKVFISKEGLLTESGIFGTRRILLKWYKVQAIVTHQGLYQHRNKLVDLYLDTAAGTIEIPYLELSLAHQIRNYVLYKVESDERDWM